MRSNTAKKLAPAETGLAASSSIKLIEKFETDQYDELVSVDYEAFLLQYGIRSDFA